MLDRAGRLSETVCLRLLVPNASAGNDPISGFSGVRTIEYTKSWLRALPRMLMGVPIVLLAAISLGASILALGLLSPDSATQGVVASVVVVLAVVYYCSALVLPTINREAKVALRRVLRAGQTARTNREAPQGIGGWLILSVIGLIMAPYSLLTQFWLTWENLTTPGIVMHHYLSGPLITFGIIELLVIIALSITTLVLLFRKSKKTPAFAIALLGINAVFIVLDHFLVGPFPTVAQQADPDDARGVLIVAIVVAAICIRSPWPRSFSSMSPR